MKYKPFDLVIIDRIMPGMSGDKLFLELKGLDPSIKAVISSGYFEEDREELLKKASQRNDPFLSGLHNIINPVAYSYSNLTLGTKKLIVLNTSAR